MKQATWKRLSQRILLKHARLTVYEDRVVLPTGATTSYIHFGTHHDAATVIVRTEEGKILLQREYSYPPNDWLYQFPGGGITQNEKPHEGAQRELAEEAKLSGTLTQLGWFYPDNRRKGDKFFVYLATDLREAEGQLDPEEDIESYWFTEDEIDHMIHRGDITNYSALAAWALYKARAA